MAFCLLLDTNVMLALPFPLSLFLHSVLGFQLSCHGIFFGSYFLSNVARLINGSVTLAAILEGASVLDEEGGEVGSI